MEPPKPGMKRVTVRPKCPNPLFEKWLDEWRMEAASKGADIQYCFSKALESLRKYPLVLKSGRECKVLNCFGDRLCELLDSKLVSYRKSHPEIDVQPDTNVLNAEVIAPKPARKRKSKKKAVQDAQDDGEPSVKASLHTSGRPYIPAWRSGPFALLITLFNHEEKSNYKGFMLKAELQHEAQPLCDKSFTRADAGSYYTAWSSMSQLVEKGLVRRVSSPAKFSLSDEGREMAKRLKNNENEHTYLPLSPQREATVTPSPPKMQSANLSVGHKTRTFLNNHTVASSVPQVTAKHVNYSPKKALAGGGDFDNTDCDSESPVVLESGSFDIFLLVDTCETGGASKKYHNQTVSELTQLKVPFEVRKLEVGDFVWIARSKKNKDSELVLPYIVERKRMDDLGSSIKDNRFREQKFRLKQSGISNLIYLVESHGSDQHVGLPLSTLQQAAVNTQVVDGFIVKHTIDHCHSMAYLASLTNILGRNFQSKTLLGCQKKDLAEYTMADDFITLINFKEFKRSSKKNKNFTVKEMFIRHLVQLKGLSVEKAHAIAGRYPTPQSLMQAYRFGGNENMLTDIPCEGTATCRNVGAACSKAVFILYGSDKLH